MVGVARAITNFTAEPVAIGFIVFSDTMKNVPAHSQAVNSEGETTMPRGVTAFGVFLLWGAVMASLAGISLLWRGTALDQMWSLNSRAYRELTPLGAKPGIALLLVAAALATAGIGWFKRRLWAWRLSLTIITTQILGGLVNIVLGRVLEGVIGLAVAGALLFYLIRVPVRAVFAATVLRAK